MNGAFYIAATGLRSEQQALDVVANNIANINTAGFKRSQIRFSSLVASTGAAGSSVGQLAPEGAAPPASSLLGVMVDSTSPVLTEGQIQTTSQPMDMAINGSGFIELIGTGGQTMLWRGGTLQVNADGYLAAPNGMALKAMISVPTGASNLTISPTGAVSAQLSGSGQASTLGQIDLIVPKDETQLTAVSGGLFQMASRTSSSGIQPGSSGAGSLMQGAIEGSNVQLTDEMTTLLLVQRAYAANAQVVQAGDQLMAIANGLRR